MRVFKDGERSQPAKLDRKTSDLQTRGGEGWGGSAVAPST